MNLDLHGFALILNLDPFWESGSVSGPRRAEITHKKEKFKKCLECYWSVLLCYILIAGGFPCSMDVLREGSGINIIQFKNICTILKQFISFGYKSLDPDSDLDPYWPKIHNPDPHWNQCGSTTLVPIKHLFMVQIHGAFLAGFYCRRPVSWLGKGLSIKYLLDRKTGEVTCQVHALWYYCTAYPIHSSVFDSLFDIKTA